MDKIQDSDKKYSPEDYKKMIERFMKDKSIILDNIRPLLKPSVYGADLFNLSDSEYINLILKGMAENSKSIQQVYKSRNLLSEFFDWCIENGYLKYNIFDENPVLSRQNIKDIAVANSRVQVLSPNEIDYIVNSLNYNKNYLALLLYGFYEGIGTAKEFADLKYEDINPDNKTVKIESREIKMSEKFFYHLNKYRRESEYIRPFVRKINISFKTSEWIQMDDYVLKIRVSSREKLENESVIMGRDYVQRRIAKDIAVEIPYLLEKSGADAIDISVLSVVYSGILYDLREKLAHLTDEEFSKIFTGHFTDDYVENRRLSLEASNLVSEVARNHGIMGKGSVVKNNLQLYYSNSEFAL